MQAEYTRCGSPWVTVGHNGCSDMRKTRRCHSSHSTRLRSESGGCCLNSSTSLPPPPTFHLCTPILLPGLRYNRGWGRRGLLHVRVVCDREEELGLYVGQHGQGRGCWGAGPPPSPFVVNQWGLCAPCTTPRSTVPRPRHALPGCAVPPCAPWQITLGAACCRAWRRRSWTGAGEASATPASSLRMS
jgi:hypothetical protein